jgi:hypothetical protein
VHQGDLFPDMAHRLYVLTSSYMVRRREAGKALRFQERVPIYEDWACFGKVARLGEGAFLDRELAWQHGQAMDRVSDANDLERLSAHLHLLDSIWAEDSDYQATHEGEFLALRSDVQKRLAGSQIVLGRMSEARETLRTMSKAPASLRLLSMLPSSVVGGLLGLRRKLRSSRG